VSARVTDVVGPHPDVRRVDLVGSRARGGATALSDWDFHLDTSAGPRLARELPALVAPLEPLAAQWDRLTERATYMLMLPGAIKVDLFPGEERRRLEPLWRPAPSNLAAIDAHFWDWALWLGGKTLAAKTALVAEELGKMHAHLLEPLGIASPPVSVTEAVAEYRMARDRLEHEWEVSVPHRLGDEVAAALGRYGVT
jgi:hypothetical protein